MKKYTFVTRLREWIAAPFLIVAILLMVFGCWVSDVPPPWDVSEDD